MADTDPRMKALRLAVMSQAIRYVDSWQVGDGPATFRHCDRGSKHG
jgi:hypothetical protein